MGIMYRMTIVVILLLGLTVTLGSMLHPTADDKNAESSLSGRSRVLQGRPLRCPRETRNSLAFNASAPLSSCNNGVVDIAFDSRTYLYKDQNLPSDPSDCEAATRGGGDQCSSFSRGAFYLSGKGLEYDVDLSRTKCGRNAAMYLAGMIEVEEPIPKEPFFCQEKSWSSMSTCQEQGVVVMLPCIWLVCQQTMS